MRYSGLRCSCRKASAGAQYDAFAAVSSLDVQVQAQVIDLLDGLKDDFGRSYIFIADDLPVVRDFADRVIVMQEGRQAGELPRAQATQENIMRLATGGTH